MSSREFLTFRWSVWHPRWALFRHRRRTLRNPRNPSEHNQQCFCSVFYLCQGKLFIKSFWYHACNMLSGNILELTTYSSFSSAATTTTQLLSTLALRKSTCLLTISLCLLQQSLYSMTHQLARSLLLHQLTTTTLYLLTLSPCLAWRHVILL